MNSKEIVNRMTLKKEERLKSRKTIQSLFVQNQHLKIYPFKLVWLVEENTRGFSLKISVSVTKRLFKLAVKRNTLKRKMRECIRINKNLIIDKLKDKNITLSFMLIYQTQDVVTFNEFNAKIKQLLIRLGDKITKSIENNSGM